MFSIWLSLLIVLSVNIIVATNLRCNEDINGSLQVVENCRACVIFIAPSTSPLTSTTTTTTTTSTPLFFRHKLASNTEPSIEELFLFDEKKRRRRRRRQNNADTVIYQQCARELDGPLYGYDQTHCFCNSNQCNSNIQRCIYEVTSKRHFACYHGSNSSQSALEIHHKCRSCRIHTGINSIPRYECLTFGEREQNNRTDCTCQRPMCNQDVLTCQRFQQLPSRPRTNSAFDILFNSTVDNTTRKSTTTSIMTTTSTITTTAISDTTTTPESSTIPITTTTTDTTPSTTTTTVATSSSSTSTTTTVTTTTTTVTKTTTSPSTTTTVSTTFSVSPETEEQPSAENSTEIELATANETTTSFIKVNHLKTLYVEVKNNANHFPAKLISIFTLLQTFFFLFIYSM